MSSLPAEKLVSYYETITAGLIHYIYLNIYYIGVLDLFRNRVLL